MAEVLDRLLTGDLSKKAGGFLLILPSGFSGRLFLKEAAIRAYGTEGHPDLKIVDPDKKSILVDDIRDARRFISTSAMGGQFKTLMVIAADRMNQSAANAFLKMLEEPGNNTRVILCSDQPWSLPPTILSRCQSHQEVPPADAAIQEVQAHFEEEIPEAKITDALKLSRDHPSMAREIIEFDLAPWFASASKWISDPKGPQPTLKAPPKKTPDLLLLMGLLQNALVDTINQDSGGAPIPGWTPNQASDASAILLQMMRGSHRPGIDWKTRLHSTLSCLARAA